MIFPVTILKNVIKRSEYNQTIQIFSDFSYRQKVIENIYIYIYIYIYFFFDRQRQKIYIYINNTRVLNGQLKAYRKYTIAAKRQKQKREGFKKLIKELGPSSIHSLAHDQKLLTKEYFNL